METKPVPLPILARAYRAWAGLIVLVVVGSALGYVVLTVPKMFAGGSLDASAVARAVQEAKDELVAAQSGRKAVSGITRDEQIRLSVLTPSDPDVSGLLANVANLAASTNLILHGVDATPEASGPTWLPPGVGSVAVTLSLGGIDYAKLKIFLGATVLNARLLDFVSVGFSPKTPDVTLQLRTYYVKKSPLPSQVSVSILHDPRFLKLSTAAIKNVQVGETGRENPFEPSAP